MISLPGIVLAIVGALTLEGHTPNALVTPSFPRAMNGVTYYLESRRGEGLCNTTLSKNMMETSRLDRVLGDSLCKMLPLHAIQWGSPSERVSCGGAMYAAPSQQVKILRYFVPLIPVLEQQVTVTLFRFLELDQLHLASFLIRQDLGERKSKTNHEQPFIFCFMPWQKPCSEDSLPLSHTPTFLSTP